MAVEVARRLDGAVACLRERNRQLVEVDKAEPQLAPERRGHAFGDRNEFRRRGDLELGEVPLGHLTRPILSWLLRR